jgi:hypothetical protein
VGKPPQRPPLGEPAAQVRVGQVDGDAVRPGRRGIEPAHPAPVADDPHDGVLRELLGYVPVAAVEAEHADEAQVLGPTERDQLVVHPTSSRPHTI